MAPVTTRQYHSFGPGVPHPPKRPPNTPVKVDKSIDPKVFGELLAGTVMIFVLAVLFWKIGGFIRRFNRGKVLRVGKDTRIRYARTWYGWVTRATHERNKRVIRGFLVRVRELLPSFSIQDDYSWIWWDPGDVERRKRRQRLKRIRWLPECFRSYDDYPTADDIWNPCSRVRCHGALTDSVPLPEPVHVPDIVQHQEQSDRTEPNTTGTVGSRSLTIIKHPPVITRSILEEIFRDPLQPHDGSSDHIPLFNSRENAARPTLRETMLFTQVQSLPTRQNNSYYELRKSIPWSSNERCQPISCQLQSVLRRAGSQCEMVKPSRSIRIKDPKQLRWNGHQRRYRGWSARMQIERKRAVCDNIGDSSGPPGTPITDMLASYVSDPSSSLRGHLRRQRNSTEVCLRISEDKTSFKSRLIVGGQVLFSKEQQIYGRMIQWYSAPVRGNYQGKGKGRVSIPEARPALYDEWRSTCDTNFSAVSCRHGKRPRTDVSRSSAEQLKLKARHPTNDLSDWELRLLERLDRKLVWLSNEMTPGQKPYHFALLANHWLNKETWLVYDPVSRVSNDARRKLGDPRFNVPYPLPDWSPRPKYPVVKRRRAQIPRIDSWRAAVNKQRRISGVRDAIRTITLYDESAEEPPDGHIDPGCWVLPKPPQGFEMSTAQKNAWYEGGAGWQEKLEDWQHVHRGYRVRKALHEGRVNRNRLKEVASQVRRCCRTASGKLIASHDPEKRKASNSPVS